MKPTDDTPAKPILVPVILAGGNGTRLWPLSRQALPKQFLSLGSRNSLLQQTALRLLDLPGTVTPAVIAAEEHRFLVREHMADIGLPDTPILLEPCARNTAAAAAVASGWARRRYGEHARVLLMPADHVIHDLNAFRRAVIEARDVSVHGKLITFGVSALRPETGFGYIRIGEPLASGEAYEVREFVEKPDRETAEQYVAGKNYLWNSGMFLFRADALLEEMQCTEPEIAELAARALDRAEHDETFLRLDAEAFEQCTDVSLDVAVMERSSNIALVPLPAGTGWDDIGSWSNLHHLREADEHGNSCWGDVQLREADNNLVYADKRLVTLLGVSDLVVVETGDAILVTDRAHAQQVKSLVGDLKAQARSEVQAHPRVYRPWGFYETISAGDRFQSKRIRVNPGQKLSLQMHHHRSEHWVVVRGTAVVTIDGREQILSENQSTYIPLGVTHRLYNPGKVALELIEVQSGAYLGEDDIVRLEDAYGRTPEKPADDDGAANQAA